MRAARVSAGQCRAPVISWSLAGTTALVLTAGLVLVVLNAPRIDPSRMSVYVVVIPAAGLYAATGHLIIRRLPANAIGWLLSLIGLALAASTATEQCALYGLTTASGSVFVDRLSGWLSSALALLTIFLLLFLVMLFPDGRLPSRRWRPLPWAALLTLAGAVVYQCQQGAVVDGAFTDVLSAAGVSYPDPVGIFPQRGWFNVVVTMTVVLALIVVVLTVASVFARRIGASPERREQLAWLGYVGLITAVWVALLIAGGTFAPAGPAWLGRLIWTLMTLTPLAGIPLACVVAVTKYRLYEIDRLISRTVSYAIVTGLLIGVYAGLVLFATHALPLRGPVAVAGSTLIAAALFAPVRQRVQKIVDRRFNRSRYDAEQLIVAFAARLQDATDPDAVRTDLIAAASRALEPAHVSLWSGAGQQWPSRPASVVAN
jgi:hypothetical protein